MKVAKLDFPKKYDKNRPLDLGLLNFETIGLLGLRKDLQQFIVRQEVEASKAIPQQSHVWSILYKTVDCRYYICICIICIYLI